MGLECSGTSTPLTKFTWLKKHFKMVMLKLHKCSKLHKCTFLCNFTKLANNVIIFLFFCKISHFFGWAGNAYLFIMVFEPNDWFTKVVNSRIQVLKALQRTYPGACDARNMQLSDEPRHSWVLLGPNKICKWMKSLANWE